jgi:hypothetical protein
MHADTAPNVTHNFFVNGFDAGRLQHMQQVKMQVKRRKTAMPCTTTPRQASQRTPARHRGAARKRTKIWTRSIPRVSREKHAAVRRWRALTHCAGTKDQCVEGDALAPRLCVLRIELRPIEAVDLTKPVQRRGAARRASGTAKRHDSE